ncbi:MAG: hypothetical protein PWP03_470 [Candidatus Woesearchaeota archaeon]|nr:hypothetical protein [Candidatus Woesearchaeota archaeon]
MSLLKLQGKGILWLFVLFTVFFSLSLVEATIDSVNLLYPSDGATINSWSNLYFEFNFTGNGTSSANCSLFISLNGVSFEVYNFTEAFNRSNVRINPEDLLKDISSAPQYWWYVKCENLSQSQSKSSTVQNFNVASGILPSARLFDKYLTSLDSNVCGYGGTNDVTIKLYVNGTEFSTNSTYADSIVGVTDKQISEDASRGQNYILVEDSSDELTSSYTSYYLSFEDEMYNLECFQFYPIDSISGYNATHKKITLGENLRTDVPAGTKIYFHIDDRPAGWFNIDVSSALSSEGFYSVSTRVNKSRFYSIDALTLGYDLTAPNIALNQKTYFNNNDTFEFNVSDSVSGVENVSATLTYPNGSTIPLQVILTSGDKYNGIYGVTLNFTDEGQYTLNISAIDYVGHSSKTSKILYFDETPPEVYLVSKTNFTTKTVNLSYKYLDDHLGNCTLYVNGVENQSKSNIQNDTIFWFTFNVTQTDYRTPYMANIEVKCNDLAGNLRTITHSINVEYLPKELFWNYKKTLPLNWLLTNISPFNFIGFTNLEGTLINISTRQGLVPLRFNSTQSNVDNPIINTSYALYSESEGTCYFRVNSSEEPKFKEGYGIRFENHNLDNFTLYTITNAYGFVPSENAYLYNITPCLVHNITSGEKIYIYNNSGKPSGWFNISLDLFEGINNVSVVLSKYNEQGYSELNKVVVYDTYAPTINVKIPQVCMISPSFEINVSGYSPLDFNNSFINISNATETAFYLNSTLLESNFSREINDTTYNILYHLAFNESLTGNLKDGDYNLSVSFNSIFNKNSQATVFFSKDSTIARIPKIDVGATQVGQPVFKFNWTPIGDAHLVTYYYNLYESTSDFGNEFVKVLNGSTNDTNVTINYESAKLNHGYLLEVYPVDECGNVGEATNSSPIVYVDLTPPTNAYIKLVPSANYTNSLTQINATWSFIDPESENLTLTYEYCIVKPDKRDECLFGGPWLTNKTSVLLTNLSLEANKSYELRVRAENPSKIWSEYYFHKFTVDIDPPENASITYTPGPLTYTKDITITVDPGNDSLSGIFKADVYLMKANLIVEGSEINCGAYDDGTLIKTLNTKNFFTYTLENGYCYKLFLRVYDEARNYKDFYTFDDYYNKSILLDTTPPSKVTVYDESFATTSNTLYFNWTTSEDNESGIKKYVYTLRDYEGNEIVNGETNSTTTFVRLENLNLTNGMEYYLEVFAVNYLNVSSEISRSDGILYLDRLPPEKAVVINVSDGVYEFSSKYYDLSNEKNATFTVYSEGGSNCVITDENLGYTDIYNLSSCTPMAQDKFECTLPAENDGVYTYYIACKDAYGNIQGPDQTLKINLIKTYNNTTYKIIEPNATQNSIFMPELGRLSMNISTFSPIKVARINISNGTETLLIENLTLENLSEGLTLAYVDLNLTSYTQDLFNISINITDIFNRTTFQNYTLIIQRNKPSYIMRGLSTFYSKKQDLQLNVTAYLFNNLSINITNSTGGLVYSYINNSNNVIDEKQIVVPLNFTNSTWTEDKYLLTIYLYNNESNESVSKTFDFIVDNTPPVFQQPLGPKISDLNYDDQNITFQLTTFDYPDKYPSGIKSVTLYYNVSGYETRSNSTVLDLDSKAMDYEIWKTTLLPGTFKPGSIINYTLQVEDYAGNVEVYKNQFNISNRPPEFITDRLKQTAYRNVPYTYIIYVNDSDIYKNISCVLDTATTTPSQFLAQSNISVVTINNSACRLSLTSNYTGFVQLSLNLSDGLDTVNQQYLLEINKTEAVLLNLSTIHLVEVQALFDDRYISEGKFLKSTNVTLPKEGNTSLLFKYDTLEIATDKKPYSEFDNLSMKFLKKPENSVSSPELNLGLNERYKPKSVYAIEFNKVMNYTIVLNYSGLISNIKAVKLFEIPYDYEKDTADYSDTKEITNYTINTTTSTISFVVQNFSLFVLSEDSEYTEPAPKPTYTSSHSGGGGRRVFIPKPTCNDSIKNQNETDVDCGGVCGPCFNGKHCLQDSDCYSGYCNPETKVCENFPTCDDGIKNQDETDVDCGGSCSKCPAGKSCISDSDCITNYCYEGVCRVPTCNDGIKNQDETDIDCGGVCGKCEDGKACNSNFDCISKKCVNGICAKATCDDGIKNQDETDVDCGGSCGKCPDLKVCKVDSDCLSGYCYNFVCRTPTCNDGIKNQGEQGIDCGGPCKPCESTEIQQPRSVLGELYAYVLLFVILLITITTLIILLLKRSHRKKRLESIEKSLTKAKHHKPLHKDVANKQKTQNNLTEIQKEEPALNIPEEDKNIIETYIRNLVKKSIAQGMPYSEIKTTLINKGYSMPEFLEIAKEEYISALKKRIKAKVLEFRKRGLTDEEIIERFKLLGFSEDEAKSFLE